MQNWDSMQTAAANQVEHNNWYNNMFAANIKTEPGTQQHTAAPTSSAPSSTHLENYLKQQKQQQQQQFIPMDTSVTTALTPSPTNNQMLASSNCEQQQQFFDTAGIHHQLMQQQHYQQHFQQAQQAAAQNQATSHLPLGFNPLTPPGLPQAVLPPAMSHFYNQTTQKQPRNQQQTPSPQTTLLENSEKSTLTPSHTPPMDITPPKSPKAPNPPISQDHQADQELMSNSSEDLKYIVESDDDETIRLPIYNSHGKMKNYKCKSCGMVAITKLAFWEHAKTHMKPEKILQCSKCPFVTELKHHLEYHIRKHKNLKPFQCDKCSYSCVNKSMLNSHRKSHSSVYQYRCADCDYATKYCHSFKLHLRKYDHKPGLVLDEEGLPNPSIVIDVYGTRRGPKNKGCSGSSMRKSNTDLKMSTSQLSAALQGFSKTQMPNSPAKSSACATSDLPGVSIGMSLQRQHQQLSPSPQVSPSQQTSQANPQNGNLSNILPPLASLLQQNHNMAFFPYWNLNLQVLAAQQQAAVLAQLSPSMREQLQKLQNNEQNNENQFPKEMDKSDDEEELDQVEEEDHEFDRKSVDSAMDLSQGTPTKDEQQKQTPESAINLKLPEDNVETPLYSTLTTNRRKGRVLKLDQDQLKNNDLNSAPTSPEVIAKTEMPSNSSAKPPATKVEDSSSADESMGTGVANPTNNNPSNNSNTSTASSSGNSSNSSSAASNSNNSTANSSASATPTMYECKYCDIFFKDAVLYTIHMGYHSCDDVFKCNMCGEKCDGPVGLFVHMARNAHS